MYVLFAARAVSERFGLDPIRRLAIKFDDKINGKRHITACAYTLSLSLSHTHTHNTKLLLFDDVRWTACARPRRDYDYHYWRRNEFRILYYLQVFRDCII